MNCPTCGGALRLEADKDFLICDFCKNMYFPDPDADGVRLLGEPAAHSCPVCGVPLAHAAVCGCRLLACERCRGLLIPMDAFMAVIDGLKSQAHTTAWARQHPDPRDLERRTLCPACGRAMDTHFYGGSGNVVMDSCSTCHLNWLDYGELRRIVQAPDRRYNSDVESMI
jgi:Zn-finger nucleic acid-binding protein